MQTVSSALNSVQDAKAAEKAVQAVNREARTLRALRQELASLGAASAAERKRVKEHDREVITGSQAAQQAVAKVTAQIQAGQFPPELGTRLSSANYEYGQAMVEFAQEAAPLGR
jgi:hypothetical protein